MRVRTWRRNIKSNTNWCNKYTLFLHTWTVDLGGKSNYARHPDIMSLASPGIQFGGKLSRSLLSGVFQLEPTRWEHSIIALITGWKESILKIWKITFLHWPLHIARVWGGWARSSRLGKNISVSRKNVRQNTETVLEPGRGRLRRQ